MSHYGTGSNAVQSDGSDISSSSYGSAKAFGGSGAPVVSFENVSKFYGSLRAVDGLSLDLRPGERDVLEASADGRTIAQVARQLCLSEGTVRNYLSACIQKTGARNRAEALKNASERGWL
jgi:DNA-binding NarL/FixJ family response regulator